MIESKFIHELVEEPYVREFTPLLNSNDFIGEINRDRKVIVDVSMETSKSVSISIAYKQYRMKINQNIPGFKLLCRTKSNMWSNNVYDSYHFKILSTQGNKELIEYVEQILRQYIDLEHYPDFTCYWYKTSAMYRIGLETELYDKVLA